MISRRIIRVKVMQALYALETAATDVATAEKQEKLLQQYINQTQTLLVYILYVITAVAKYAETDAKHKAGKHLPSAEDLNVNIKLAGNEWLWKMLEDNSLQTALQETKACSYSDTELIKKIYLQVVETSTYKTYAAEASRNPKSEKQIIEWIANDWLFANEAFTDHLEDVFTNWEDDGEIMLTLIQHYLQKPGSYNFQQILSKEKWSFAKDLLHTVQNKKEQTMALIKPKLKNWDADRIAALDMILMQMGVCEFLYFETIPPKVTINEYIDLAKEYSTPQSGHFVNGILDNIHKDLVTAGDMQKTDFRKT
jgi:transcription antitermination protein NusB